MDAHSMRFADEHDRFEVGVSGFVDPLGDDEVTDEVVVTTRRGICRVALVAAEAAGRFQRDGVRHDPMTWMLAPRSMFQGASALDACVERDACMRAILVHGLSLGLDADPGELDHLLGDDDDDVGGEPSDVDDDIDWSISVDDADGRDAAVETRRSATDGGGGERLFTATVATHDGFETIHAFHASLARDMSEVAGRLYMRLGGAAADATIVEGFEADAPMVEALVAPAMRHMLEIVAADPDCPIALGLDVNVEQRFLD